jgi:sec-independent protein translocase protein TatA
MGGFSFWHILLFALLVMLLFGGNRFSAMMGDVAKGLKSFKQGMADDDDANRQRPQEPRQLPPQQNYNQNYQQPPIDLQAQPRNNDAAGATPPPPADDNAR